MIHTQVMQYCTKQAQITYHLKTVFYKTYKVDTKHFLTKHFFAIRLHFLSCSCIVLFHGKASHLSCTRKGIPIWTSRPWHLQHVCSITLSCRLDSLANCIKKMWLIQDLGGNKGVKSRKVTVQSSSRKEEKSYRVKGCSAGRCGIPSSKDLKVRGMKPQHYYGWKCADLWGVA